MKTFLFLLILIAYAVGLMYLGLVSIKQPISVQHLDKVEHFIEYFVFSFLIILNLWGFRNFSARKMLFYAFTVSSIHGISLEILQGFTLTRETDVWDGLADILGAALGGWLFVYVKPFQKILERLQ